MDLDVVDAHDRISELPDFIVHHILSYLDYYPDVVRTSVLSKKWLGFWASFPILDFDLGKIARVVAETARRKTGSYVDTREGKEELMKSCDEKLIKYATYTMSRFSEQNVRAQAFKLSTGPEGFLNVSVVDEWIGLVVERDVQEFCFFNMKQSWYRLPKTFLSARSLTSLKLVKCEFPSSLMIDGVKFESLKSLSLIWVPLDEEVIKYLTTACSLIEEFNVLDCSGHKSFSVSGLENLERVEVRCSEIEMIDISAPNLTYFSFSDKYGYVIAFPHINLACKSLKTLHLSTSTLKTAWFCEFISNFPLLENVHLKSHDLDKKFMVSSPSLRTFELDSCFNIEEIKIDAPNLLLFRYNGYVQPLLFSVTSTSAKWEAYLSYDLFDDVDILWFRKLKQFLNEARNFRVLDLHVTVYTDSVNVDELMATVSAPYELDHLRLTIEPIEPLSSVCPVLDAIFWCCRPSSLSCSLDSELLKFELGSDFFKFLYEKLLLQENQCPKEIEIVASGGYKGKKVFANLSSLLDALPRLEVGQKILFKTKSVV